MAGLKPDAVVVVATVRALKHHGGVAKDKLNEENLEALEKGLPNLLQHDGIRIQCLTAWLYPYIGGDTQIRTGG